MHRLFYYTLCFISFPLIAQAQPPLFGNEWINYQQTYYKIPIAQKGLYRLAAADLQKAGLPTATLDPRTLQLFHRGVEQAIWVEGETDGKLDAADYLEFIGQGNDGVPDSALYRPASAQLHPYYSLFSDTTAYFLTTRLDGQPGRRMGRYTDLDVGSGAAAVTPEPYVWVENLRVFSEQWSGGTIYPIGATYSTGALLSGQDVGEGWMGISIKPGTTYSQSVSFAKAVDVTNATPTFDLLVIGRTPVPHSVQIKVGPSGGQRTLEPLELENYNPNTITIPLSATEAAGEVICTLSPQNDNDEISLALLRSRYPHQPDMSGYTYREFRLNPVAGGRALLRLTGVPATARFYDITTPAQTSVLAGTLINGTFTSVVRGAATARKLLMVSSSQPVPVAPQRVSFRNLNPATINFALIAHPLTRGPIAASPDAVTDYAAYRASRAGGSYDTLTISTHQLYNQFSYGERSPLAIRRFADYLARGSTNTKYVLLVGRSVEPHQNVRRNPLADTLDMIPNDNFPGSDLALVTGIAGKPAYVPGVAIGRLFVTRPQQVLDYLNKLKAHEATPATAPWHKQLLHLSGGKSAYELTLFRSFVDDFNRQITGKYVGGSVETVAKQTDNPTEEAAIASQVNRGVGVISLFGHSSLDVADLDIGYVSNDRLGYRNKGRYPVLLASGCAAGNFFYHIKGFRTFISDWVLTPDRGAILALANTYNGFASPLKNYSDQLYAVMTDSAWVGKPFGDIQMETIRRYVALNQTVYDLANAEQITLQGDPAVRLFPFAKPDLSFSEAGTQLKTTGNTTTLRAVALNLGRSTGRPVSVRIRAYDVNGKRLFSASHRINGAAFSDTLTVTMPLSATANTYYELYADADGLIDEERRDNNLLRFDATGQPADLPFEIDNTPPVVEVAFDGRRLRNDELVSPQPVITVLVDDGNATLPQTITPALELYLQRPCSLQPCPFERLPVSAPAATWVKQGNAHVLTFRPATALPNGTYTLEAYATDGSGNRARPYGIRFSVRAEPVLSDVTVAPNPFNRQTVVRYTLSGTQPPAPATLRIIDGAGRTVRMVPLQPVIGTNEFIWDGTADGGAPVANGTYLYRLDIPGYDAFENNANRKLTGKLLLVR